jgi:tripartite-type tricarboxylate transporter receptor subunit TctC
LLADAKANPGKISYGTPGVGTTLHLTMEQIAKQRGIQWTHVPFRGTSESTSALLGGHISAVADASGWAPLVESGQLRLLVIWTDQRAKTWPNVPTLKELALPWCRTRRSGWLGPKAWTRRSCKSSMTPSRRAWRSRPTWRH